MYTVYILQSQATTKYYIGVTSDMEQRLRYHNTGVNRSTRGRGPWQVVYRETFSDKRSAWLRERQIKSYKGGRAFKELVRQ